MKNAKQPINVLVKAVVAAGFGKKTKTSSTIATMMMTTLLLVALAIPGIHAFSPSSTTTVPRRSSLVALQGQARKLGLLSFDLDDTLFPTGQVVRAANEVMIATMQDFGCTDATIPVFLDNTRAFRKTLDAPITYRDLRKSSIRKTLQASSTFHLRSTTGGQDIDMDIDIDVVVNDCYEAWVKERHAAAERLVFDDAVETLQVLRSLYPDACIAAITNGAGDPLCMTNSLAPFFDFRVSGEDDEVFPHRKPHPYIYEYTLKKYGNTSATNEGIGVWCHVGDCLANDVGASTACGAQAIWMCMEDDEDAAASRLVDTKKIPEWSTATTSELEQRAKQIEEGKQAVAAKIDKLSQLPEAIALILEKVYS
jgi:FMN phosphatase YigB (HAD superfamily)